MDILNQQRSRDDVGDIFSAENALRHLHLPSRLHGARWPSHQGKAQGGDDRIHLGGLGREGEGVALPPPPLGGFVGGGEQVAHSHMTLDPIDENGQRHQLGLLE